MFGYQNLDQATNKIAKHERPERHPEKSQTGVNRLPPTCKKTVHAHAFLMRVCFSPYQPLVTPSNLVVFQTDLNNEFDTNNGA